jgi:molybdopterin synthase catalytic subunit
MNKVKLLFFATLRDRAGARTGEIEVPEGSTVRDLKDAIAAQYPAFKDTVGHVLVAINREYAHEDTLVPEGAEVALFPPVSGG